MVSTRRLTDSQGVQDAISNCSTCTCRIVGLLLQSRITPHVSSIRPSLHISDASQIGQIGSFRRLSDFQNLNEYMNQKPCLTASVTWSDLVTIDDGGPKHFLSVVTVVTES